MRVKYIFSPVIILSAVLLTLSTVSAVSDTGLEIGQVPPKFNAKDLAGGDQSLDLYKGNVVVLHFWATWCPYCRGECPKLTSVHDEYASLGVTVISVSVDQDIEALEQFVKSNQIEYVVIPEEFQSELISEQYDVPGIPVTYIIDRDGRIAFYGIGPTDIVGELEALLEKNV